MGITRTEVADHIVRQSAAMLDQASPNWHERVSAARLNMSEYANCLLAQAFGEGSYSAGRETLTALLDEIDFDYSSDTYLGSTFARRFGFDDGWLRADKYPLSDLDGIEDLDGDREVRVGFDELTAAWRRLLSERNGGMSVTVSVNGVESNYIMPHGGDFTICIDANGSVGVVSPS